MRNYLVFHELVPLRSNLGMELYVGNNENYDLVHPRVWPNLITQEKELYRFFRMGEMPFMHEEMRKAVNFMVAHPGVEVRLTGERVEEFWMGTPAPFAAIFGAPIRSCCKWLSVCNLLAVLGTIAGIAVLYARRSEFAFPLAVSPVIFPTPLLRDARHAALPASVGPGHRSAHGARSGRGPSDRASHAIATY